MRVTSTTTFLLATLALATPAPVARPKAEPAPVAEPLKIETREQFHDALAARDAEVLYESDAISDQLEARRKIPKAKHSNSTSAADMMTPSRALQLGALGLGVVEVVRLWG